MDLIREHSPIEDLMEKFEQEEDPEEHDETTSGREAKE